MKSGALIYATVGRAVMNEQFWVRISKTLGWKISKTRMQKGTLLHASAALLSPGVV